MEQQLAEKNDELKKSPSAVSSAINFTHSPATEPKPPQREVSSILSPCTAQICTTVFNNHSEKQNMPCCRPQPHKVIALPL